MEKLLVSKYKWSLSNEMSRAMTRNEITKLQKDLFLREANEFLSNVAKIYASFDQLKIFRSLQLMTQVHNDQEARSDTTSYIRHPLAVATSLLKDMSFPDKDILTAALLHDAVEDQSEKLATRWRKKHRRSTAESSREAALSFVGDQFGGRVAHAVNMVSNEEVIQLDGESREALRQRRLDIYQKHFLEIIQHPDAFLIKLADFANNVLTISELPKEQQEKYAKRYGPLIPAVVEKLQDENLNLTKEARARYITKFLVVWNELGRPNLS